MKMFNLGQYIGYVGQKTMPFGVQGSVQICSVCLS